MRSADDRVVLRRLGVGRFRDRSRVGSIVCGLFDDLGGREGTAFGRWGLNGFIVVGDFCEDKSGQVIREQGIGKGLTLAVYVWVLLEARLHQPKLFNAVDALGLFLAVDKARERGFKVLAARTVGHAAETGAIPVDLARFLVVRRLLVGFLGFFLDQVSGRVGGQGGGDGGAGFGFVGVHVDRGGGRGVVVERRVGRSAGLGGDCARIEASAEVRGQ